MRVIGFGHTPIVSALRTVTPLGTARRIEQLPTFGMCATYLALILLALVAFK